jgi:hypothetical protein
MPEGHHKGAKRRGQEGVHGSILHEEPLQRVARIFTELIGPWRLTLGYLPHLGKKRETNDYPTDIEQVQTVKKSFTFR